MQAIQTKYIGPTNTKPARISAECEALRIVLNWPHEYTTEQAHRYAALVLVNALNWNSDYIQSGYLKNGSYVHTLS